MIRTVLSSLAIINKKRKDFGVFYEKAYARSKTGQSLFLSLV